MRRALPTPLQAGTNGLPHRRGSVWQSRRTTLFLWQAVGLTAGAAMLWLGDIESPHAESWRIFFNTLWWSWVAAAASAALFYGLVGRQPYLHFTVALVSIAAAFAGLFVWYVATHAAYSRWAIVVGISYATALHACAWQRWRRLATLKLGVVGEAMRERMAPASRFPADASSFERCDWHVVSDLVPLDEVDGVVLPDDLDATTRQSLALNAKLAGVQVYSESFVRALLTGRLDIERADDVFLDDFPTGFLYASVKRGLDVVGALILGVVALPITLICLCLIRIESAGHPLLLQPRIGYRGAVFRMCKLRTMTERPAGETTIEAQQRITRLGRLLRRYRFDELPQLWNVLRGDMSLIGPRPEWTESAADLERMIPQFAFRYLVRPGITGWAQVHQGHVTAETAARTKVEYDLYYAKNVSFALDLAIGSMTLRTVLTGWGAK